MQELEPTWRRALSIFWLIMWRCLLGGVAIGFAIGAARTIIQLAPGIPDLSETVPITSAIGAGLWGLVVVRMALRKRYKGFRIALLPAVHSDDFGTAAPARIEPRS